MTKELRRLSIVMLLMFIALFASTSIIQVVQADALGKDPANTRTRYDSYEVQRGSIIVDGAAIASSVPADDIYRWQRTYVDADMWAPVTGYFNTVLNSRTELERAENDNLSGTAPGQFLERLRQTATGQVPRGSNVELSLDATVQRAAYDALAGKQGAVVAIEPATGRILAMATSPSYDTNLLASHDTGAVNATYDQLVAEPSRPMDNRAIAGNMNPPGSTFKLVVASAALATGEYTPQSTLPNPSVYQYPNSSAVAYNAGGGSCGGGDTVTIADALRLSCNIPFAELAVELGNDVIRTEAEKYGFNAEFQLPLTAAASQYPRTTDAAEVARSGFGQGDVRATPLQMAMVSAGIANGGSVMKPHMVDSVIGADLSVLQTTENSEFQRALDEGLADQMRAMMVANVSDGAASGARIDGVEVGGKTGTAENGDNDPYSLWFTGFAPADDPQVAVAVVVEDGGGQGQSGSGNTLAAPIAKKVMEAVLGR
jgi:peptidoglycan glycosyltransferase